MKFLAISMFVGIIFPACYAEWDVPKVPRHDPCTDIVQERYVYVSPECRHPLPPPDLNAQ